jgi:hypothetical protein
VRLTARRLNRTLLLRQHLSTRTSRSPEDVADHLLGLHAQDPLAPYLSLAARRHVPRADLTEGWVRLATLRGATHLHTVEQARWLRPWLQPALDKQCGGAPVDDLRAAVAEALADGPLAKAELTAELGARLPSTPTELVLRLAAPVVVRGDEVRHFEVGAPPAAEEVVRRFLAAYGPATAADLAVWSSATGLGPTVRRMDDLVRFEAPDGRTLYDVPDGVLADEDAPAPVRLLGAYDGLWLAHAARDRVTAPGSRDGWRGGTGAVRHTVFVDGWLTGTWRPVDGRVADVALSRGLTPAERAELDEEVSVVEAIMAS